MFRAERDEPVKRFASCILALAVLCTAGYASAAVFFVEEGGPVLHRDPPCEDIAPGDLPEKMTVVRFSSWDELYASAEG
jgi:hypothetical protein